MTGWDTEDIENIVQKRRMRVGARRRGGRGPVWVTIAVVVLLLLGAGAWFFLRSRPTGLATLPDPAVDAPDTGGFNATIGANNTITIGLEIRNLAGVPVTVLSARIVAPDGLTRTALTIVPVGNDNRGFDLSGPLPSPAPIQLGTDPSNQNAIVAARFTVDCRSLLAASADIDETIFVTIQVDGEQREEQITPPVVGDQQWLSASAQRMCLNPVPTGSSTDRPLPPQPGTTPPPR